MFRWRLMIGVAVGLAVFGLAVALGAPPPTRGLIGWNLGALTYLALVWQLFLTATEAQVRARGAREDERRWVILTLIVCGVGASLTAIIIAMLSVKGLPAGERTPVTALAALTLVCTWLLLQTVFALHYAHEHFRLAYGKNGEGGVVFPCQPARTYMDFVYLAICVGATAQVSDPTVTSTRMRNLVTAHAALAFFYNTAVLALGINILASLLSG